MGLPCSLSDPPLNVHIHIYARTLTHTHTHTHTHAPEQNNTGKDTSYTYESSYRFQMKLKDRVPIRNQRGMLSVGSPLLSSPSRPPSSPLWMLSALCACRCSPSPPPPPPPLRRTDTTGSAVVFLKSPRVPESGGPEESPGRGGGGGGSRCESKTQLDTCPAEILDSQNRKVERAS